jgi:hypothetical protein
MTNLTKSYFIYRNKIRQIEQNAQAVDDKGAVKKEEPTPTPTQTKK